MDERQTSLSTRSRVAVLWRGNPDAPETPAPHEARLAPVVDALNRAGFAAEGVVWFDERAGEIEAYLSRMQGVLVWINPLQGGRDRTVVDAALRRIAHRGVWVATHPDVAALMGTKEVLYTTRELGWGSDTDRYEAESAFDARFWARVDTGAVRVLKPLRGNDGQGVMKIARGKDATLIVQHAGDDRIESISAKTLEAHVRNVLRAGPVIDQAFNDNAAAGMVRCYMSQARVVGFAAQQPRRTGEGAFGMNSAKAMHPAAAPVYADLRRAMEEDWVPGMQRILDVSKERLPALWDADFFYRANPGARSRFVLCEINVSCVSPFPEEAPDAIAAVAARCLKAPQARQ